MQWTGRHVAELRTVAPGAPEARRELAGLQTGNTTTWPHTDETTDVPQHARAVLTTRSARAAQAQRG